jgi:DNA repair protein RecO (recombination protein O)
MPLRETEAIVLRSYRIGESDKVVSLFSRQFGRIRGAATGAQRPKSRYGGLLEPLTYIRLWLYEREHRDLVRINSAELLESFFDMQGSYHLQLATQYLMEAGERFLPEREVNERAFRLFLAVQRGMKSSGEADRPLVYFNLWMLTLGGFIPPVTQCAECGRTLTGEERAYYGREAIGFVCSRCRNGRYSQSVCSAVVNLLDELRHTPLDSWLRSKAAVAADREARRPLEAWAQIAAEKKLVTLEALAEDL